MPKEMEGDSRERRRMARSAREHGKKPSDIGATLGASKQRAEAPENATHQERIDLKRQGKQESTAAGIPETRPGARDRETPDRERYPRLD